LAAGTTQQYTAIGTFTDGSTQDLTTQVVWSTVTTMGTNVAVISNAAGSAGFLTAQSVGTADVNATITGPMGTAAGTATLTVTSASLLSIAVTPVNPTIARGTTQAFTAT